MAIFTTKLIHDYINVFILNFSIVHYYKENQPYYKRGKKTFSFEDVLNIVEIHPDFRRICTEVPQQVQEDASFLIDTSQLSHREDFKLDGLGKFRNTGHSGKIFQMQSNVIVSSRNYSRQAKERTPLGKNEYLVRAVYWVHQKHSDFKKRTYQVTMHGEQQHPLVFVQYIFESGSHSVTPQKKIQTSEGTKAKIRERVRSSRTPSPIYDDIFEEAGGLEFKNVSDLPRSIDQIKYERRKARQDNNMNEFASMLHLSKGENSYLRNLQWTPFPRVVVATNNVVQDVVDNCTNPEKFAPFTMDTTFNVGDFFVTTTSYKHLKLIDARTGKHPCLPGPALFHVRQGSGQFTYFAQTLQEMNNGIGDILAIGSDRCQTYANGFAQICPVARIVVCKKHAEDDVCRKLIELGINEKVRNEFMWDIFGNESTKELGLIDSESEDDFEIKLLSLMELWNQRECISRDTTSPEFYNYFKSYVAKDMKEKMILQARRAAGLGDEFFYDNATESINHRFKVHIRQSKEVVDLTGSRNLDCTLFEACQIYNGMLEETRRNIHRAVLGQGPYRLAPDHSSLRVDPYKWKELNEKQRMRKLRKLDSRIGLKDGNATSKESSQSTETITKPDNSREDPFRKENADSEGYLLGNVSEECSPPCKRSSTSSSTNGNKEHNSASAKSASSATEEETVSKRCDFDLTGLPEVLKGSWLNAQRILNKDGVGPAPGDPKSRIVVSTSRDVFHRVKIDSSRIPKRCDCERFEELKVCAHIFAVAFLEETLDKILDNCYPQLSSVLKPPVSVGKKPHQTVRKRKSTPKEPRDLKKYKQRIQVDDDDIPHIPPDKYQLVFAKDTKMRVCYGCGGTVRPTLDFEPPSPWDIVFTRKEFRVYNRKGTQTLSISANKENVYYHPRMRCLKAKNADVNKDSVYIPDTIKRKLDELHRKQLRKDFGVQL